MNKYICYWCGSDKVIWQNDFTFDECGYEGQGLVRVYTCPNCNADIEYMIPSKNLTREEK